MNSLPALKVLAMSAVVLMAGLAPASAADGSPPHLNSLIDKIASGQAIMMSSATATGPADWTFIDMEHGPYDVTIFESMIEKMTKDRMPNGSLVSTPVLRIPLEGDEEFKSVVKQVLDVGAFAITFPRIETKEQALKAVSAMRYPQERGSKYPTPAGIRGSGPARAAKHWGIPVVEYYERADVWPLNPRGELLAIMLIESPLGVKNAREIMNTPGVGAIRIGANDLSQAMGLGTFSKNSQLHPEVEAIMQSVGRICKEEKKVCGATPMQRYRGATEAQTQAEIKKLADYGFRLMQTGKVY